MIERQINAPWTFFSSSNKMEMYIYFFYIHCFFALLPCKSNLDANLFMAVFPPIPLHNQTLSDITTHGDVYTDAQTNTGKKKKTLTVTDSTPQEMLSTVCGREFHSVWHEGREEIQREHSCTTEDTTLQTSPDPRFPATCENEPTGSSRIFCFAATRE